MLKYLTLQLCPYRKSMSCDEKNGDKNQLRNNLGDNRGTKIKREIPQLLIFNELRDFRVPRTGLEPARLAALAPETSASTIPPPGLLRLQRYALFLYFQNIVAVFFLTGDKNIPNGDWVYAGRFTSSCIALNRLSVFMKPPFELFPHGGWIGFQVNVNSHVVFVEEYD